MRLRASYVLIGGLLLEGRASSSPSSAGEALAQVTDGEPPLCLMTSLVGLICVAVCAAGALGFSEAGAAPEAEARAAEEERLCERDDDEETYSSGREAPRGRR